MSAPAGSPNSSGGGGGPSTGSTSSTPTSWSPPLDTPALLGVRSSVSCYHLQLPLTPVLFGRDEGLRAAARQAYAVVRPAAALPVRAA
ncbi:tRNA-dependent cyclodipeptide synthase [Kitasatospora aureofaciens]|uniref:tRNA-dependent cyclodipeptide synthase n=1 Tax=Kitasatospora aureofaciens TaxID=1894 RepID=UPI003F4BBA00